MIGSTIGTYRLAELLGDGGLGPVYRGVDQPSGREAAFRVFTQEVSRDPMLSERLRAMSGVLKKLQHPNIGAVYELLSVGPDLGMFLEFVPGSPLNVVGAQAGRLEMNVAVSCAVQVLRALEFAHGIGVLHHALRPSNIRVTPEGTVKVMDFGIGHAFGANRKTREDRLLTVLAYLAPEQIQNQPGDARSDIYAVGVVLYELLTGRLPFDQTSEFALRQSHLHEPVAPPRAYEPALPEWLDQAVMRALAKNPGARFQNATECRAVLEAALGLSTSKAAAVVRDVGGATVAMFDAAPPIPASHPPSPVEDATRVSGPVPPAPAAAAAPAAPASVDATVVLPAFEPPGASAVDAVPAAVSPSGTGAARTNETVLMAPVQMTPPVEAPTPAAPGPAAKTPAMRTASKAAGKGSGILALVAVGTVVMLAAAAAAVFFWWQFTRQAAPVDGQAAVTPAAVESADTPPSLVAPPADQASTTVSPPVSTLPPPVDEAPPASQTSAAGATPPSPGTGPAGARGTAPPLRAAAAAKPRPAEPPAPQAVIAPPPAPPPAERAAAAPPPVTRPPAHVVSLPDVSFRKIKLIAQEGAADNAIDVVLMFLEDRVTVTPTAGGTTLRSVRYGDIRGMTYAREEKKRLGLIKTAQHLLTVDARPSPLLLRLDKDNVDAVVSAFESRTGKPVSR